MGVKDMEGMTVTRADFFVMAKENLERADKEEKERISKAKVTYLEARKREKRDPRKRKIGNAGFAVGIKRPSMETASSCNGWPKAGVEEEDDNYSYREEEELVDEREERWQEEDEERWREEEEEDNQYHDGDGLV